ncbi:MAG: endolytic transglycosylase MltG [Candidatus Eisenbacteria bacterium]
MTWISPSREPVDPGLQAGARRAAKRLWPAAIPPLVLVLLVCAALVVPSKPYSRERFFHIETGECLRSIEDRLAKQGLIRLRGPLLAYGRLTGLDRRIRPGTYELSASQSPLAILKTLVAGDVVLRRVTIPEGFTTEAILTRLSSELGVAIEQLRAAAADTAWIRSLGLAAPGLEGYLFPETFLFDPQTTAREALAEMVAVGEARFDEGRRLRASELGLSRHEILTLASIIELEAADEVERRRVSAVYRNRLLRGLLLQADPTAAYAAGRIGQRLSLEDLAIDSPYNTYLYPGLPPGPICSPGLASIDAALWPLEGCDDLYFVSRGDGTHAFSRTLEEHNQARGGLEKARQGP